jgi:hypothetical protein
MKLIYRQTGNNCYEIIEDYKGKFNAGFWQTIALVFGRIFARAMIPSSRITTWR